VLGTRTIRAAGGVITRVADDGATEVLLVHRPRYDDWTFPKGKVQPGETEEECALREVEEETGLRCELLEELSSTRYLDRKGRPKTARYWRMKAISGAFQPTEEVDECRWLTLAEASKLLSYEHDLSLIDEVAEAELQRANILLVRHVTAGHRKDWRGDDTLRPLDEEGRLQAMELAETLGGYKIRHILSSPYVRCVQSVEPLAELLGLDIEEVEELAEGAGPEEVQKLVDKLNGELSVLCTHGDVIERIIGPDRLNQKGGVWVLESYQGGLRPVRYLPAPRT
jgi:8-oxo-dGTP diphosphatase